MERERLDMVGMEVPMLVVMVEAIAAMEVIMERERLDMVVMEVPMLVAMVEVMEEDMVEDTGDDLSNIINSLSAFDFSNSCILSSPGFGCLLLNPIQGGGQKTFSSNY